ncbi:MAG: M48 family metalloprotease [Lewinellaceae bacterium]|nr:M48 family metalloprotease [Lewinellaceae bacterium]
MKNLLTCCLLLFISNLSAQDPISILHGCNFEGDETEKEYYTFETSNEADKIVKRILDGTDVSHESIIVKEANVKNALASTVDKRRYILYSTAFLEKFKGDAKTKWAAYTVLAHEIGHHLNGHDFSEKDPKLRRKMESRKSKAAAAPNDICYGRLQRRFVQLQFANSHKYRRYAVCTNGKSFRRIQCAPWHSAIQYFRDNRLSNDWGLHCRGFWPNQCGARWHVHGSMEQYRVCTVYGTIGCKSVNC